MTIYRNILSFELETELKIMETILSGIRATGRLHLGNLLGAVNQFVKQANEGMRSMYFIADFHTLTTYNSSPEELRRNIIEIVKDYLAAGLDPVKSIIFAQSSVPAIAELSLLISMRQPFGEVNQLPTIKDLRSKTDVETLGLLSYPVLMAADILGAKAGLVPVGKDQIPNVELAQQIAKRFNNRYGLTFVVPRMLESMVKVPGLDGGKMGKSEASNAVSINAPMSEIRETYMKKGVTDPERVRKDDPGDPFNRCRSIYPMHEIITPGESESREIAKKCQAGEIGCRDCKALMLDQLEKVIEPFQERRRELDHQDDYVFDVLRDGGRKASEIYQSTLDSVRYKLGLQRF